MTIINQQSTGNNTPRVAVVGAGAAGLFATHLLLQAGFSVSLFEASAKIGKSILATGNGRCNISNAQPTSSLYNHPEFVSAALERWDTSAIEEVFSGLGLLVKEEDEGRKYPLNGRADSVVRAFELAFRKPLATGQLRIQTHSKLATITAEPLTLTLVCAQAPKDDVADAKPSGHAAKKRKARELERSMTWEQSSYDSFDTIIVAVGRHISPDHLPSLSFVEQHEVLTSLRVQEDDCALALNDRIRARVSIVRSCPKESSGAQNKTLRTRREDANEQIIWDEEGEVFFKNDALSGIVMFNASRFALPGDRLLLDLLPHQERTTTEAFLKELIQRNPHYSDAELLQGMLPWGLARLIEARAQGAKRRAETLARLLHNLSFSCANEKSAQAGQVVRGGIACSELDRTSLECHALPGCYVLGEALDIDAPCGGYNLHWAWTSAYAASMHIIHHERGVGGHD